MNRRDRKAQREKNIYIIIIMLIVLSVLFGGKFLYFNVDTERFIAY